MADAVVVEPETNNNIIENEENDDLRASTIDAQSQRSNIMQVANREDLSITPSTVTEHSYNKTVAKSQVAMQAQACFRCVAHRG